MNKLEKRIPLATPTMHGDEQKFVNEAFETNWIAPVGPHVDAFEKEICDFLDIKGASAVASGTAALHLCYKLADIKSGEIVLVQDLTFSATINPIIYQNAIPVFIDSEYETWNMDPKALEIALEKYKDRVKAVVPVHLYGTPSKIDEIIALCKKYNVKLIEDACESMTSTYKGKETGTFGDYNAISFNGNKLITTSSGGVLVSNNVEACHKAKFWATQAKENVHWYEHKEIGYNYRMSNVCAGIGRGQLLHIREHTEGKTKIFRKYKNGFKNLDLIMNPYESVAIPNFWLSCILLDKNIINDKINPEALRAYLDDLNIESRRIWKPMHMQPIFEKYDYIKIGDSSVSKDIFERGLCLPSDLKMTENEQEIVIEAVKNFLGMR